MKEGQQQTHDCALGCPEGPDNPWEPYCWISCSIGPSSTGLAKGVIYVNPQFEDRTEVVCRLSPQIRLDRDHFLEIFLGDDDEPYTEDGCAIPEGLLPEDIAKAKAWIRLNKNVLRLHWSGEVFCSDQFIDIMKKL